MNLPFLEHEASTVAVLASTGFMPVLTFTKAARLQLKNYMLYPPAPCNLADAAEILGVFGFDEFLHTRCLGQWLFRIEEWPAWRWK